MSKLKEKVETILDELQEMMETNQHLTNQEAVYEVLDKASLYWAHLDDEGKDYVHCARDAVEEKTEWKV